MKHKTLNGEHKITVLNGIHVKNNYVVSLCPVCHEHFLLEPMENFLFGGDDSDKGYLFQPKCWVCGMRFEGFYCGDVNGVQWFDGFRDNMTGELIASCDFPPKDFIRFPLAAVVAECAERVPNDSVYEPKEDRYEVVYDYHDYDFYTDTAYVTRGITERYTDHSDAINRLAELRNDPNAEHIEIIDTDFDF